MDDHKGKFLTPNPFRVYNEKATHTDRELTRESSESVDTMLIFAGLFSAVVSAIVAQTTPLLQPDQTQRTNDLLLTVVALLNGSNPSIVTKINPAGSYSIPPSAVVINISLFLSLILSLLAALVAMLIKQWARQYELGLGDHRRPAWQKARKRAYRHRALQRYHFSAIILWVPMLLHVALLLFFIGIIVWLYTLHITLLIAITALVGTGLTAYLIFAIIPAFDRDAPFKWPMSYIVSWIMHPFQRAWAFSNGRRRSNEARVEDPPRYILSPGRNAEQDPEEHPPDGKPIDIYLLTELLGHTVLNEDADAALECLRRVHLNGAQNMSLLVKHKNTILHNCRVLADSCWNPQIFPPEILSDRRERSWRLCQFIEWFYYQLSVSERMTGDWPNPRFADILYRETLLKAQGNPYDDSMFEDLVLSSSVLSKLHHVRLHEGERCSVCWEKGPRMSRDNVVDCVRMFKFPKRKFHAVDWDRPRALAESIVASNSECLANYFPVRTGDRSPRMTENDYNQMIDPVVTNQMDMMTVYMDNSVSNYRTLRLYQATLTVLLLPGDPRLEYFDFLGPLCAAKGSDPQALQEELVATEAAARQRLRQDLKHSRILGSIRILSHKDEESSIQTETKQ